MATKKGAAKESFGQALKEARKKRRATLREVAEKIGKSVGYISDIEHDRKRPPDLETVSRIEDFLLIDDGSLLNLARKIRSVKPRMMFRTFNENPDLSAALLRADRLPKDKRNRAVEKINDLLKEMEEDS